MAFSGHIELRRRAAYPQLAEMPSHLALACRKATMYHAGHFDAKEDFGKLKTSPHHLNDHVLHVHYTTGPHNKDVIFTMGVSDFDVRKKKRVPGNDHIYIQTREDRCKVSVLVAEMAIDLWEDVRAPPPPPPPPPPPARPCPKPARAIATFDGTEYGSGYLSFTLGAELILLPSPLGVDSESWMYAQDKDGSRGWVPPGWSVEPAVALATFNGTECGSEYLSFALGAKLFLLPPPLGVDSEGWVYAEDEAGSCGWVPPEWLARQ